MHAPPGMFDPLRDRDPVQAGGYRLRARLGSGGMGEVFLSFDRSGLPIAVKVLRGELADDRQFRARFAQEVRSARRVRGAGIAPLVDADPEADAPWLATEYIPGPTLADAIELYGPLPVSSVLILMAAIAGALKAIHASGIVHRDLKPPNVVLGADGLRVIDFGIARAADATPLTLTGMLVGSPQYVAPEQALGLPPAPAGDIFSLGALAHYAATGRPAYGDGPRIGVLYRIVNERPDLAGCPRQIRSLLDACLAREPADRPSTDEIAELCTPPDDPPRTASDWLPMPVVFAIDAYRATLADIAQTEAWAEAVTRSDAARPDTAQTGADPASAADVDLAPSVEPDFRTPAAAIASAVAPRDLHDVRDNVAGTDATASTSSLDAAPDAGAGPTAYDSPDVFLIGPGPPAPPDPRHRAQRGAWGVAATIAVLAAGIALAVNLPSSGAAPGSVAAFGGATPTPTAWPGQPPYATHPAGPPGSPGPTGTPSEQSGQGGPLGFGPPTISALGPPPGPPPGGAPPGGPPPGGFGGPPPPPTVLWWSGTVRFDGEGLWLDATPPSPAGGQGDIRESSPAPAAEISSGAPQIQNLAAWTGSGTPTGAQCQYLALTHGTWQLHVSVGDTVCALTAYHQVAVLRIESFPADGSGVTASAAVWGTTSH